MPEFGFNEAHEMLRKEIRSFVRKEMAPNAKKMVKQNFVSKDLENKMAGMGLLGLNLPAKYGGQQMDWVSLGIVVEELSRADQSIGALPILSVINAQAIMMGSEEIQQEWIPAMIRGEKYVCQCLTEPSAGSDAAAIQTKAIRDGDSYIITGEKTSVTRGIRSHGAVVFAKTNPELGPRGISTFFVPLDLPGISRDRFEDTGWKELERSSITFDNVRIPAKNLLGNEGSGFYTAMGMYDWCRPCMALRALGPAQASLEEATEYAKERVAFGKPIAKFEAVAFKLAHDATLIDAARLISYRALWLKDQGLPHAKESAMAKWWGPKVALDAIHNALLIHGHFGFVEDLPFEQRLRDVIGLEIGDGTEEIMKAVISREMLGKAFASYK